MTPLLVVALLALAAALAMRLLLRRRDARAEPPRVRAEFWVYTQSEGRPDDKALMSRLLAGNPHAKPSSPPIGPAEGITMSDIRLHIGVVKREKNAMLFQPEVWAELDATLPDNLHERISSTQTIIIVRFVSEEPIGAKSYLQFVTHASSAFADLTAADLVFDTEAQKFYTRDELYDALQRDHDATRFDLQVSVRWTETSESGVAFTRGMAKAGLPDIEFGDQPLDQKTLALFLVEEAARMCWNKGVLEPCELNGFGEQFLVEFSPPRPGSVTHRGWLSSVWAGRKRPIEEAS